MKIKIDGVPQVPGKNSIQIVANFKSKTAKYKKSHGAWACSITGKEHYNCTRYETGEKYTKIQQDPETASWDTVYLDKADFIYPTFLDYVKSNPDDKYFYPGRTHNAKEAVYLSFETPPSVADIKARCQTLGIPNPTYMVTEYETQVVWILKRPFFIGFRLIRKECMHTEKLLEVYFPEAKNQGTYSKLINPYIYNAQWLEGEASDGTTIYSILEKKYREDYGKKFSGFTSESLHDQLYNECIKYVYKVSWEQYNGEHLWPRKKFYAWFRETFPELVNHPDYENFPQKVYHQCEKNFSKNSLNWDLEFRAHKCKSAFSRYEYSPYIDLPREERPKEPPKMTSRNILYLKHKYPNRSDALPYIKDYFDTISPLNTTSLPRNIEKLLELREIYPELYEVDISRVYKKNSWKEGSDK